MTSLKRAMSEFVNEITMGAPRSDALRTRLREIQANNGRYFLVPVVMLALVFAVAMALIIRGAGGASTTTAVASLFGISLVGMIRLMLSFWREKVATELMIELSELDDDVLRTVVARLLSRMK